MALSPHQIAEEVVRSYDYRSRDDVIRYTAMLVVLAEANREVWLRVVATIPQGREPIEPTE